MSAQHRPCTYTAGVRQKRCTLLCDRPPSTSSSSSPGAGTSATELALSSFCPFHMPVGIRCSNGSMRVACRYNAGHIVWEEKLAAHEKQCLNASAMNNKTNKTKAAGEQEPPGKKKQKTNLYLPSEAPKLSNLLSSCLISSAQLAHFQTRLSTALEKAIALTGIHRPVGMHRLVSTPPLPLPTAATTCSPSSSTASSTSFVRTSASVAPHSSYNVLFRDQEISGKRGKHTAQESNIVSILSRYGLCDFPEKKVYLEPGCGKATLSYHLQRVLQLLPSAPARFRLEEKAEGQKTEEDDEDEDEEDEEKIDDTRKLPRNDKDEKKEGEKEGEQEGPSFILVDREKFRSTNQCDNRMKQGWFAALHRLQLDLKFLRNQLPTMLPVLSTSSSSQEKELVIISKHLCGEATDFCLASLFPPPPSPHSSSCASSSPPPLIPCAGICLAFCCHHLCSASTFVNNAFLEQVGMDVQHPSPSCLSSSASSSSSSSSSSAVSPSATASATAVTTDFMLLLKLSAWVSLKTTGEEQDDDEEKEGKKEREEREGEENAFSLSLPALSRDEKRALGSQCKFLLDLARAAYVQKMNPALTVTLLTYTDLSNENVLLLAHRSSR